jgi:hypothetical protein
VPVDEGAHALTHDQVVIREEDPDRSRCLRIMVVHLPSCRIQRCRPASGQARAALVVLGTPGASQPPSFKPPSFKTEDRGGRQGDGRHGRLGLHRGNHGQDATRRPCPRKHTRASGGSHTPADAGTTLESAGCSTYPRHMHLDGRSGRRGG